MGAEACARLVPLDDGILVWGYGRFGFLVPPPVEKVGKGRRGGKMPKKIRKKYLCASSGDCGWISLGILVGAAYTLVHLMVAMIEMQSVF